MSTTKQTGTTNHPAQLVANALGIQDDPQAQEMLNRALNSEAYVLGELDYKWWLQTKGEEDAAYYFADYILDHVASEGVIV